MAIRITIPLTTELRQQVMQALSADVPPGILGVVPIFRQVPTAWTIEACGCVVSLLPMLSEVVARDVQRTLTLRRESMTPAPVESLEQL